MGSTESDIQPCCTRTCASCDVHIRRCRAVRLRWTEGLVVAKTICYSNIHCYSHVLMLYTYSDTV